MKSAFVICLFASLSMSKSFGQGTESTSGSGDAAPEFTFVTLNEDTVSSNNLRGKVIVLDFWSSDCSPCRRSIPQLEEFYRRYRNNPRVAFYFVNSGWETLEKAKAFASRGRSGFLFLSWGGAYDLPFAYDRGSATLKSFGFDSNPSTVIIDTKFRVRENHSGYRENLSKYLVEQVERYLREL